ncbi:MAG: hypothetical protein JW704_00150 [Anaerolineaceae bacterium]|nr:hypothetical protein [Anaerolineaceae bacterium]MBN2678228.1 hypothetical protein [Anaerolineaceae bacterium]
MLSLKPNYDESKKRMDAFWERELIDRPLVQIQLFKPAEEQVRLPVSGYTSKDDEWMDAGFQAEWNLTQLSNQLFLGDTMPVAYPNLDMELMAVAYGCPIQITADGAWYCKPIFQTAADTQSMVFNWDHPTIKKVEEITSTLLETGTGTFITSLPGTHTGVDCLAALMGPMKLAAALINEPVSVRESLKRISNDYRRLFNCFFQKYIKAGQPITTWIPLVSDDKFDVIANDFSIMVSDTMYRDLFLEDVIQYCRFLDRSFYHIDGLGALRHLDAILEIGGVNGVQFAPPPGQADFCRWVPVYRRIQMARKCVQVNCDITDIDEVMNCLDPAGLYLVVHGVSDEEAAEALIRRLEQWTRDSDRHY